MDKRKQTAAKKNKFRSKWVVEFPTKVAERFIYVVQEGNKAETLIFKCPCGCDSDVYLNLLEDSRPRWKFNVGNRGKLTVFPSIWRTVGCRSHFHIRNGKVVWVNDAPVKSWKRFLSCMFER